VLFSVLISGMSRGSLLCAMWADYYSVVELHTVVYFVRVRRVSTRKWGIGRGSIPDIIGVPNFSAVLLASMLFVMLKESIVMSVAFLILLLQRKPGPATRLLLGTLDEPPELEGGVSTFARGALAGEVGAYALGEHHVHSITGKFELQTKKVAVMSRKSQNTERRPNSIVFLNRGPSNTEVGSGVHYQQFVEKSIIQSWLANWISKCGPYVYIGTNRKA